MKAGRKENPKQGIASKQGTCYKITDRKIIGFLFFLCFGVYFSTYIGRLNYSASLAEIIHSEGFSKGSAGMIGTVFFFAYGAGQLISGFLGDRLPCRYLVFGGLGISGVLNGLMGIMHTPYSMAIIWGINGLSQAFIWSPLLRLLYDYLQTDIRLKLCLYMNFSVPLGTIAAYGLSAVLIAGPGWRSAFYLPSVWLLVVAVLWFLGMGWVEHYAKEYGTIEEVVVPDKQTGHKKQSADKNQKTGNQTAASFSQEQNSWKIILTASGLCILLFALCVQGALKDGVTTWVPTYLGEKHNLGSMAAILSTMIIPLCNFFGVTLASLADRYLGRNEVKTSALFFGVCAVSLTVLLLWGDKNAVLALAMLAISTTSMMAVNTMLIAVMPSRFGRLGKASSVSGVMNSCVYVGGAISTYGIGALSAAFGWNITIGVWVAGAIVSVLLCMIVSRRWKEYAQRVLS